MTYREDTDRLTIAAQENPGERRYWLKNLEGELIKTGFPYDGNKNKTAASTPGSTDFQPAVLTFVLAEPSVRQLLKLSKGVDHTLHMILTAAWVLLLARYTGNKDIIVGTTIYKQKRGIESGFINTVLPLRFTLTGGMTFKDLLLHVREIVLNANKNQNYPIEVLLEELNLPLSEDASPLFDSAILLENIHSRDYLTAVRPAVAAEFVRRDSAVEARIEYHRLLYDATTIERIMEHFKQLLSSALNRPETLLPDIEMMTGEEKQRLLMDLNATKRDFPHLKTIHALFEEQVERDGGRTAIVDSNDRRLTYRELNEAANRLAHFLRKKGVGPDVLVGLIMEPSLLLAQAVLAVLKAGGAYMPIDPRYPQERIRTILEDSGVSLLLTLDEFSRDLNITALKNISSGGSDRTFALTPPRPQIKDFDALPIPDRGLASYEKIHQTIGCAMARHTVSIQASRGCPFNCAYCHKIWPKSHVVRSAENILAEILYCYEAGARRFTFIDDVFNLDKKNTARLFHQIIFHKLDVQLFFPNGLRGDVLTKETIDLMVEAGAVDIGMALESASPRIQKLIRKNLDLDKFAENIRYIIEKYPRVILELEMIAGFPTETEEEALMTLDFLKNLHWVHFPNLHILKIYRNTDMFRLAVENGVSPERIDRSASLAYHQLPDTLPFSKSFARQFQARFMNEYILNSERLKALLPHQMNILTENELVEKYDSYLPMEIRDFPGLLEAANLEPGDLGNARLMRSPQDPRAAPGFSEKIRQTSPPGHTRPGGTPGTGNFRILLLDLSQVFRKEAGRMLYDVIEEPLGLMYLATYLDRMAGDRVRCKVAKSRVDFENYEELKELLFQFKPHLIGIRTLTYYKEFFHRTVALVRQWGVDAPVIAGGPYATSDYNLVLKDPNVDLAVLGEGELTLGELVEKMMANGNKLPGYDELRGIAGIALVEPGDRAAMEAGGREILSMDHFIHGLASLPAENPAPVNRPDDLLYVISTSGSTGKPKGIMMEHRTLVNLLHYQFGESGVDFSGPVLQFASTAFDISPQEMFCTLLSGGCLHPVSTDMKGDISRLLEFMAARRVTAVFMPPAVLNFIFSDSQYAGKFPGSVRHIIAAGEQLTVVDLLRRHLQNHHVYLHNHYGPAETHVATTHVLDPGGDIPGFPPIGRPIANTAIYLLDPRGHPVPTGVGGELHIAGTAVGRGYLNRPGLTAERFINRSYTSYRSYRTYYQTGDLARWLPGGVLEFLGRKDRQVKIRGFRIELKEIERHIAKIPGIKEAAVIDHEAPGGEKSLCAYIVPAGAAKIPETSELRDYLGHILPDYMIPAFFMELDRIPLTANGKLNRGALPAPELNAGQSYTAPGNHVQHELVDIWSHVLDRGAMRRIIGIDDNFFDLGGHSLKATVMIAHVHKRLNVRIPLGEIFKMPTIRALSRYIADAGRDVHVPVEPVEKREYYPVSSAQKRMYILNRLKIDNTSDNTPSVHLVRGPLQKEILEGVVKKLIQRHEPLRTSFLLVNEEPVQRVHDDVEFEMEYLVNDDGDNVENTNEAGMIQRFIRPFDLARPPLLRVGLARLEKEKHLLMVDMHHIIKDGSSTGIFIREFMDLYEGKNLPEPVLQYRDFTAWQNRMLETGGMKKQENYWLDVFSGEIPRLNLPTDFPRPAHQDFEGNYIDFHISGEPAAKIKAAASKRDVTLYIFLLSVYNILLSKYSGQEDIVVGTPAAGRPHEDLQNMIGMFVNTLAMRNRPEAHKTFRQFLEEVKTNSLRAVENQDYQFDMLVTRLGIQPDPSRQSLFDTMFAVHDTSFIKGPAGRGIKGLSFESFPFEDNISQFDLIVHVVEEGGVIVSRVLYRTKLFKRQTIDTFIDGFKELAAIVVDNPGIRLEDIRLSHRLTEAETRMPDVEFTF
jgi:amino acid adenylation domain-containing protein